MRFAVASTSRPSDRATRRAIEYCREARRLRCRYAGEPDRMHGALYALSRRQDRMRDAAKPDPHRVTVAAIAPPQQVSGAHLLADRVEAAMDEDVLRYSKRMELLKEANRAGIGRFEANLIIAAVQHRTIAARAEARPIATTTIPPNSSKAWMTALALLFVQTLIVAAATWAWHV
jgi:hypothetical protein